MGLLFKGEIRNMELKMNNEKTSAKILIEQMKKYPYAHFEISDGQLATLITKHPELIAVGEGAVLILEASDSEEKKLHWAADSSENLVSAIQKLRENLQTTMRGKWRMSFVHPPELVEPLCQIGFEVASHYMDYWLYGLAELTLDFPKKGRIRKAVPADFDKLTAISMACCYAPGWQKQSNEWFVWWLSNDNSEIFVVEAEEHLVGYCGVQLYSFDSEKGAVVWIQALAVAPEYQRHGFGKTLLLNGLKWGQRGGAQRSFLAVDKRNHIAKKLYEGIGFRPSGAEEINLILSVECCGEK